MKKGKTLSVFLLDRSGSMYSIWNDAVGAYQSFIEDQKKVEGELQLVLKVFDTEHDLVHDFVDINDASASDLEGYAPRGATALLDAMAFTIKEVGEKLAAMPEEERPEKVAFAVMTDGYENSSKEYRDPEEVKELVKEQTEKYSWEFFFMGANIDAVGVASGIGIPTMNTMNYMADSEGSRRAMMSYSNTMSSYRTGESHNLSAEDQLKSESDS